MSSFYVIKGRDQGRRFTLDESVVRLGRDASNGIRLLDTEVSRSHAEVRESDDTIELVDLNSSNGTIVNGRQIKRHTLKSGDQVQIGRSILLFTRSDLKPSSDAESLVNIVDHQPVESESQIVSTIGQTEGSRALGHEDSDASAWLASSRRHLQVMYRAALAVSHTLDIDELVRRILGLIFESVEADRGCIMLVDPETDELIPKAIQTQDESATDDQLTISRTILDYVRKNKEGVLTSNAQDDQRWDEAASILSLGIREAICVPMQGRYGIVGVIYVDTHSKFNDLEAGKPASKFTDEHLKLMVAIGHQAALAVEDTSFYSGMVQAERLAAIGQTVATLSHHIKNILQGIRGGSYLIEEGLKGQDFDVVQNGWKIVERNQDKISAMVLDMLSFSKERKPEIMPGDLNELLDDVAILAKGKAAEDRVNFRWEANADVPELAFDYDAIHRAVLNVANNAIEACEGRPDPQVVMTVRYEAKKRYAIILVKDNGIGISDAQKDSIFKAFESGKGNKGTGLGLPVSRKIMREHSGDILVTSELGKGSCFQLVLPMLTPDPMLPLPEAKTESF